MFCIYSVDAHSSGVWLVVPLHTEKIELSLARFFPRSKVKSSVPMWSGGLTDDNLSRLSIFFRQPRLAQAWEQG